MFFLGVAAPEPDYEVAVRILAYPTGDALYLDARRPQYAVSPTQDAIRLSFNAGGVLLSKRISAKTEVLGTQHTYPLGATVSLRVKGTIAQLRINGKVMEEHIITDATLQPAGHAGFSGSGVTASVAFDDFTVLPA